LLLYPGGLSPASNAFVVVSQVQENLRNYLPVMVDTRLVVHHFNIR